jgi:hypothetical protein
MPTSERVTGSIVRHLSSIVYERCEPSSRRSGSGRPGRPGRSRQVGLGDGRLWNRGPCAHGPFRILEIERLSTRIYWAARLIYHLRNCGTLCSSVRARRAPPRDATGRDHSHGATATRLDCYPSPYERMRRIAAR